MSEEKKFHIMPDGSVTYGIEAEVKEKPKRPKINPEEKEEIERRFRLVQRLTEAIGHEKITNEDILLSLAFTIRSVLEAMPIHARARLLMMLVDRAVQDLDMGVEVMVGMLSELIKDIKGGDNDATKH